ncbi:glycosyltransferase [Candidatus Dependentiae bacterium]|nr:glycosyltransferase [Candidatus Dependentiae bacterium]
MNKKILVVGKFSADPTIYTYATSFYKTFQQLNYDTTYVDCSPTSPLQQTPLINNIARPLAIARANKSVLHAVYAHSPSLVFILKGQHLTPRTIQAIKATGARVVNFYPDNPFALWNGNSTAYILQSLPLFNCFLSWSPVLTPALLAAGSPHVCAFPFAYDQSIYNDNNASLTPFSSDVVDVCFIGTWEPEREKVLEQAIVRLPHASFGIWGNQWQEHAQSPHIKKYIKGNAVYEQTMTSIYKRSKIILNFLRAQNAHAHNMRTFEVPATKSFLLTEHTQQQAELFFKENYSIACFTGIDELVEKINTYLHDAPSRNRISERSFIAAQEYTLHTQLARYIDQCPALR